MLSAMLLLCQVETKSIPDIARDLVHLQQLAAAGKLSSQDVTGGSITISNIGGCMYMFHPHCFESA
jgi:pyruvate/2-oxoglutarate dehydrogenase complex dihydrolipoamide acyltransferase (E2) component